MGINQPKVSALMRRKLDGVSVERLINFLNSLGQDVDIVIRPKARRSKKAAVNVYHEPQVSNTIRNIGIAAKAR